MHDIGRTQNIAVFNTQELKMSEKLRKIFEGSDELYFIGEISCNHNHRLDIVISTIDGLISAGADAIKLQTDTIDGTGSTMDFDTEFFTVTGGTPWDGQNLMTLYKEAYTPLEWHEPVFDYCAKKGIDCFSTPYSDFTIDYLKKFDMPAVKVASMEAGDLRFIRRCAELGVPVIISTGMIGFDECRAAMEECVAVGNSKVALLKCVSEYPAPPSKMNLRGLTKLGREFDVVLGLSDHSLSNTSAVAAVALGAKIFEKHVKLDDTIRGPDASFSLTIAEFKSFVDECRVAHSALGAETFPEPSVNLSYSRSIFVIEDVEPGQVISEQNVRVIRPGHGLSPNLYESILGKRFARPVAAGFPLVHEDVSH